MSLQASSLENGSKIRERLFVLPAKGDYQELSEDEAKHSLNQDGTLTLKNKLIMREGTHNELYYSWESLKESYMTGEGGGLFYDHEDSVKNYAGLVKNLRADDETKEIFGDIHVTDKQAALNISLGAKWGLSPTIEAERLLRDGEKHAVDPVFLSYALVLKPAVRETMLNREDSNKVERRTNMEDNKRELQMLAEKDVKIQKLEEEKADAEDKAKESEKKAEESEKKTEEAEKKVEEAEKKEEAEESEKLCELECSIGFTSEANKNSRLEELKSLSAESRSILKSTHEKYVKTLNLNDEKAEDGKDYAEKLKENFLNFQTEFLKQNPKANLAEIKEAFGKLDHTIETNDSKLNENLNHKDPQIRMKSELAEKEARQAKVNSNILAFMKEQEQK